MNFRNISAWSIKNPVPPIVLFLALTLGGLMAFMRMPISQDPDIDFPVAIVSIAQPGAAPTELETQVAQKVEAAVRSINGVDEINSTVREGSATVVIIFKIGTQIDRAVNDVRDAVSNVRSDLPDGILEPQVFRNDTADSPIAYISAEAVDMTLEELSWYVDNTVSKRLRALDGMGGVDRGGGVTREIRVILNPEKLQAYGVTASQVNGQLRQTNINTAGGRTEIAGSGRYANCTWRWTHDQADRCCRCPRSLCRTAHPFDHGWPSSAQLRHQAR
jgi:multidrug efflux pump subunit AcrB